MTTRSGRIDASTLVARFRALRSAAHAALVERFGDKLSSRFLLELPRGEVREGSWIFQKHGAGVRCEQQSSGEVVDFLRLDQFREGDLVPAELFAYCSSLSVSRIDAGEDTWWSLSGEEDVENFLRSFLSRASPPS